MEIGRLCSDSDDKIANTQRDIGHIYWKNFVVNFRQDLPIVILRLSLNCDETTVMDTQFRELFQRAVRSFGSPFKARKSRNPRRNDEESLESQTATFQSGQNEERQLTGAPQKCVTPLSSPIAILPKKGIETGKVPSRASTKDAAETRSEDYRKTPEIKPNQIDERQLTKGSSRIVMASDGTKDCMALLLTEELIKEFEYLTEETHKLENVERNLRDATLKADIAGLEAKEYQADVEKTEDPDLITELRKHIETQSRICRMNAAWQKSLQTLAITRRGNLEHSQNVFQGIFRRALQEANLLASPKAKVESLSPSRAVDDEQVSQYSMDSPTTVESMVSVEELCRRNAREDLEWARLDLFRRQVAFENRQNDCQMELERFQDAVAKGTTSCTQTRFDCLAVETAQELTRELIDAEAYEEYAVERARALGILSPYEDQESNFLSDISDGYHESHEASMKAAVNRNFIQAWNDTIVDSEPEENEDLEEPDDWDAKTVDLSDSISLVDHSRNRKRIDHWRRVCELRDDD